MNKMSEYEVCKRLAEMLGRLSALEARIRDMVREAEKLPKIEQKEVMSVIDVAHYMGYSKQTVYRLAKIGKIPCYKPNGGRLCFKRAEIDAYAFSNKRASSAELNEKASNILNGGV
jgi:excisionase family DNA binding protein